MFCFLDQAAVNVGKRLNSSLSTSTDQCVDDMIVTNSTTYSSSALLSPTLSNASSSSASTTPQIQQHAYVSLQREENKTPTEPESNEDILIKQMIERAMKLTQQGDTRHAQHLLGVIHEKLSNRRKRAINATDAVHTNEIIADEQDRTPVTSNDLILVSTSSSSSSSTNTDEFHNHEKRSPSCDLEQSVSDK
jgi:hypothetical protein